LNTLRVWEKNARHLYDARGGKRKKRTVESTGERIHRILPFFHTIYKGGGKKGKSRCIPFFRAKGEENFCQTLEKERRDTLKQTPPPFIFLKKKRLHSEKRKAPDLAGGAPTLCAIPCWGKREEEGTCCPGALYRKKKTANRRGEVTTYPRKGKKDFSPWPTPSLEEDRGILPSGERITALLELL